MSLLSLLFPQKCVSCGTHSKEPFCEACRPKSVEPLEFQKGRWYLYPYEGPLRKLIHFHKFRQRRDWAKTYLTPILPQKWLSQFDIILPVPCHWVRLLQRGFHHLNDIFRPCPTLNVSLLKRKKYTGYLHKMTRSQRFQILKNAFTLRCPETLRGKSILVVDAIYTTGATCVELTKTLSSCSPLSVTWLFLSHAGISRSSLKSHGRLQEQ